MNNDDILIKKLRHVIREEVKAEIEPIKDTLKQQGIAISQLQNGQAQLQEGQMQLMQSQSQTHTVLEALKAGQDDIREKLETKADKADILDLGAKLNKKLKNHEHRIENLEEDANTSDPHKN